MEWRRHRLSVSWLALVRSLRSRKTDTDCIEIFVRKSRASRCTSSHFIFVMRFSTGRERRLLEGLFRHARRERLPQVSACITPHRVPQSSLGGSDDPCLSLNEISSFLKEPCFIQRLSVPFIFVLNGLPLSIPGTLFPGLQLLDCSCSELNSPSYNQILVYILHPADSTEQARSLLLSSAREQKQVGDLAAEAYMYKKIPLTYQEPLPFKSIQAHTSTVSTFNYTSAASI